MNEEQQLKEENVFLRATAFKESIDEYGTTHRYLDTFRDFKTRAEAKAFLAPYEGKKGQYTSGKKYVVKTAIAMVRLVPAQPFLYGLNW